MLIKYNFAILRRSVNLLCRITKERTVLQYGYTNRTAEGRYCLFIDWDNAPESWVRDEIKLLHELYPDEIGTVYLFKTKHGFHAVSLEKHTLGRLTEIMRVTSCDQNYKEVPMYWTRRAWVLRNSPKKDEQPTYIGCFHNPAAEGERSNAHRLFMQKILGIPKKDFQHGGDFDKETTLTMGYYHISDANN
jgi:hypothetical protein